MTGLHSVQYEPENTQPMGEKMKEKNEVQKRMQLPEAVYKLLGNEGIQKEDILYKAEPDLDSELRFARNYLVMTKEQLVLISFPYQAHGKFRFGGYAGNELADVLPKEPEIKKLSLKEISKLEIIRAVNGGSLMAVMKVEEQTESDVQNSTEKKDANVQNGTKKNDAEKKEESKGEESFLCVFSNSRIGEMERTKKNLEKIKKSEELSEDDILGKNKQECCPKCGTMYPDQARKVCPRCMDKKSLFGRVMRYFLQYKWRLCLMFVCYLAIGALNLAWPYLSGTFLYDKVLSKDAELVAFTESFGGKYTIILAFTVAAMVITKIMMQLLGMLHGVMTARIVPEVVAKLKDEIFNSMGKLSISFYNSRQTGALMTRVLDDAGEVTGFFIDGLPYIFTNAFTIIATCIVMISINPLLAVAALFLLPFLTIQSYRMTPRMWTFYSKRHRASRRLNSQLNDSITGARVVKAFGQQEQELVRLARATKVSAKQNWT